MIPVKIEKTHPIANRRLNFLLVDDDDICLFIHRRVLELAGYCNSAHSASNGHSALDILNRAAAGAMPLPDIILLDLDMPSMNGIAFLEAFRNMEYPNKQQIAIVLLTSSVSEKDKAYALSLGVNQCLSKPLTRENLDALMQSIYNSGAAPSEARMQITD
jgi:CheY-like chemotaxis protein